MTGNSPGTFTIDGDSYPVTPSVYRCVRNYLYSKDDVQWVNHEPPYVEFGMCLGNDRERTIKREITALLTDSAIGRHVVSKQDIAPKNRPVNPAD